MTKRSPSSQWFADDIIPSLDRIRGGDQYYARGLAQYDLIQWAPTIGKEALDTM